MASAARNYKFTFLSTDGTSMAGYTIDFAWTSFDGVWSVNYETESSDLTTTTTGVLSFDVYDADFEAQGCTRPYYIASEYEHIRVNGELVTGSSSQWIYCGTNSSATEPGNEDFGENGNYTIYFRQNVSNTYTITFTCGGSTATDANGTLTYNGGTASISNGVATISTTATSITVTAASFTSGYNSWSGSQTLTSSSPSASIAITKSTTGVTVSGKVVRSDGLAAPTVKVIGHDSYGSVTALTTTAGTYSLRFHTNVKFTLTFIGYGYNTYATSELQLGDTDVTMSDITLTPTAKVSTWSGLSKYVTDTLGYSITKPSVITDEHRCIRPIDSILTPISTSCSSLSSISPSRKYSDANRTVLESDWRFVKKASAGSITLSPSSTAISATEQTISVGATISYISNVTFSTAESWMAGYDDSTCSTPFTAKNSTGGSSTFNFYVKCSENTDTSSSRSGYFTLSGTGTDGNAASEQIKITQSAASEPGYTDYEINLNLTGDTSYISEGTWTVPYDYNYGSYSTLPAATSVQVRVTYTINGQAGTVYTATTTSSGSDTITFPATYSASSAGGDLKFTISESYRSIEFAGFYYKKTTDTEWTPSSADTLKLYDDGTNRIFVEWLEG